MADVKDPSVLQQQQQPPAPAAAATAATTTFDGDATAAAAQDKQAAMNTTNNEPSTTPAAHAPAVASNTIDDSRPDDFEGELPTNNELPSAELITSIENYIVLDKHGKSHTFKSLYSGPNVPRRVLVIFIRHFFCGNCQDYLRTLAESVTPDALLQLPVSTFVAVVGCGDPGLIDMYADATACPFPIYTDPTRSLFSALGMVKTWTPGPKAAYSKRGLAKGAVASIGLALRKAAPSGLLLKSGNFAQVGGEFLFEPLHVETPISTPQDERPTEQEQVPKHQQQHDDEDGRPGEAKRVSWCHRMRTTRDHAEVPELMEILGLTGACRPSTDSKRWSRALQERKGTGLSMGRQISQMASQPAQSSS
jgi:hypothetical protein